MTESRLDFLERTRPADHPNRCECGHLHARGSDGEDAGCPCADGHDWQARAALASSSAREDDALHDLIEETRSRHDDGDYKPL